MSLKKDIIALVKGERGEVRINRICKLVRWTKDGLGDKVDRLELEFKGLGGSGGYNYGVAIDAREYADIEREVAEAIRTYLADETEDMINDLRAGYVD